MAVLLMRQNPGHKEAFTPEDLEYLNTYAIKQHSTFKKSAIFLLGTISFFFVLLLAFAYYTFNPDKVYQEYETPLSPSNVISIATGTLTFITLILMLVYKLHIQILFKEIAAGQKIIECTKIYKKKYMHQNNTFHFFINSRILKTVEIDQKTFERYEINDEINVEYTPKSLKLLGYY